MSAVVIVEEPTTIVEVGEAGSIVAVEEQSVVVVEVAQQGPAGPGVAIFEQTFSALDTWIVNHNLGREPLISILNTGGEVIFATIIHTSINQFVVYHASAVAGRVRCL